MEGLVVVSLHFCPAAVDYSCVAVSPLESGPLAHSKCMLFYFAEAHSTQFHKLPDSCSIRACDQSFGYESLIFFPQTLWISILDRGHLQISIGKKGCIHLMEKGLVNKLEEHENRKGAKALRKLSGPRRVLAFLPLCGLEYCSSFLTSVPMRAPPE